MLTYLKEHPEVYTRLEQIGKTLTDGLRRGLESLGLKYTINQIGSMYTLFFNEEPVYDFETARRSDLKAFGRYFHAMLSRGIYLAPSQFESLFLSTALTDALIERVVDAHQEALEEVMAATENRK